MSLGMRKLVVIGMLVSIFVVANVWLIASWLEDHGVIDCARHVRSEYLTGTAITVVIVLLILLARQSTEQPRWYRRCAVCDHLLIGRGRYCTECGSKAS